MSAQLRIYKQKILSAQSTKKITRAMELIAASRIVKAQARALETRPYALALSKALGALVKNATSLQHPLLQERKSLKRAAVVVFSSDRGLAGAFSSSIIKTSEKLVNLLSSENKEVDYYLIGKKAKTYFDFRHKSYKGVWIGDTDKPDVSVGKDIADKLINSYLESGENGGIDEIYLVYTHFISRVTQTPRVIRLLPLEISESFDLDGAQSEGIDEQGVDKAPTAPLYEFEPNADEVLSDILSQYIESRILNIRLESAASQHAARQSAMKSATDNADKLIRTYSTYMNNARQAEITQQITEIIGGADALN